MLWRRCRIPIRCFIFEHATLYTDGGTTRRRRRRRSTSNAPRSGAQGSDVSLVTYGGTLGKTLAGGRARWRPRASRPR